MIGWAFNQLFLAGDVIYGISRPRERYVRTLETGIVGRSGKTLMSEGNFLICDHYNNRSFNGTHVMGNYRNLNEQGANEQAWNYINNGLSPAQRGPVTNYFNLLSGHNYNPHRAINTVLNEKQRRNNGHTPTAPNAANEYLAFRRACKFGLDYFMIILQKRVHFILDVDDAGTSLDFEPVVFKELYYNAGVNAHILPITYSELRKCYKKRLQYGNKLFFYLNGVRVAAPWDQNPDLWAMIDVAKNMQNNPLVELDQNGRQARMNHFVPVPKKSRIQQLANAFRKKRG